MPMRKHGRDLSGLVGSLRAFEAWIGIPFMLLLCTLLNYTKNEKLLFVVAHPCAEHTWFEGFCL